MASLIVLILYLIVMFFYVLVSFFILYHLVKFSLVSEIKTIMIILFGMVSTGLIFSNLVLFFSIDWSSLLYQFNL